MIGIYNKDTSFFEVKNITKPGDKTVINNEDVISMSVTEEMGKMITGTITLNDPTHVYSRLLREGLKLAISWGYYDPDLSPFSLLQLKNNATEFSNLVARRTVIARIYSPSGGGGQDGRVTFNCQFQSGTEYGINTKKRVFQAGTKASIVQQILLTDMQILPLLQFVDFARGTEIVTPNTAIRMDNESPFSFLVRYAREWGAVFRIAFTPEGLPAAMFVDASKVTKTKFNNLVVGGVGDSNLFEWKGGVRNTLKYTWRKNDAGGDSVSVNYVNGKPEYTFKKAEDEKVTYWKLDFDAVKRYYKDRKQSIPQLAEFTKKMLATDDFNDFVKRKFFVPATSTTAPQGAGYQLQVSTLGNPLHTAGNKASFGEGFPDMFKRTNASPITFWIRKVTHNINKEAYMSELEIVDGYTISGGSLVG